MPLSILYDARPLVDQSSGGVRRVSAMILEALLASDLDATFTCVTTGINKPVLPEPFASHPRVTHVHVRMPNKLWSLMATFGIVNLDGVLKVSGKRRAASGRIKENPLTARRLPLTSPTESAQPTPDGEQPKKFDATILPNLGFVGFMESPYALVLHDLSFLIEPRWFPLKMRLWHFAVNPKEIARRAQLILCVSETTARDAERLLKIPREKIRVMNPGIPTVGKWGVGSREWEEKSHSPLPTSNSPFLLAFSERDPRKNIATAIAAVEEVQKDEEHRDLKLVIVGSEYSHDSRLTTHDFITRLPKVSDSQLANLYRNASALLYPSWYEGFGLPLHEAARYGTPCIASTMGSLPETAPAGTVFAPPSKPHLWASMIRDVLAAPDRYRTTFDETIAKTDVSAIIEWLRRVNQ